MLDNFSGNKKALIAYALATLSVLLPWFGMGGVGVNFNGIGTGAGYFALVSSVAGLYLIWKSNKLAYVPGIVNIVLALGCKFNIFSLGNISMQGVSIAPPIKLDLKFGLIIFIVTSLAAILFSLRKS
jgi:hypothetical protein